MRWFCLDTETTGLRAGVDRICSLGAVWFQNGQVLKESHALVDPQRPIPPEATRIHGITDAMVRGSPTIAQVADAFFAELAHAEIVVGYNIPFDDEFLYEAFGPRWGQATSNMLFIDVLTIARSALPQLNSHKLSTVAESLVLPATANHTAIGDALATCRVLHALLHACPDDHEEVGEWGSDLNPLRVARRAISEEKRKLSAMIEEYGEAISSLKSHHKKHIQAFNWSHPSTARFAPGVRAGDMQVIVAAFDEWVHSGSTQLPIASIAVSAPDRAEILVSAQPQDAVVPSHVPTQLASGGVRWKSMPKGERNELYQDHVCSIALRTATEAFAFLPSLREVTVNVQARTLNLATGHDEELVIVSARIGREELGAIDLQRVDPSECIGATEHSMRFTKRDGLKPVEKLV